VKNFTFYDVVLDFILMDAFDDLENPPSSVIAVVSNRWLSNGFKETVSTCLHTTNYYTKLRGWGRYIGITLSVYMSVCSSF